MINSDLKIQPRIFHHFIKNPWFSAQWETVLDKIWDPDLFVHCLVDIYCITTCTRNDRENWKAACVHMRIGLNTNQPKQSKNPKYPPLSQLRAQLVQQNTQSYMATILYNNCGIQEKPKMSLYFSGSRAFWMSYVNSIGK